MEYEIARVLEAEGYKSINEVVYLPHNIELFQNILKSRHIDKALEVHKTELESEELTEFFEKMSKLHFFVKLRDSIFRGNFKFVQIRFDIKTSSRFAPQLNKAFFVMKIRTTDGETTVRLTYKMIQKMIDELQNAFAILRKSAATRPTLLA
ncbi:unnamed protein product [Caenorhabditis angaria]|uniref:COMM domain-containing protein n=1 Tax=Caenorhabditis angaria TaxID=860376 RepID=A0A9P1N9C0_9PELO|nr:unnamed protein product [Caenorhabditis angaria]